LAAHGAAAQCVRVDGAREDSASDPQRFDIADVVDARDPGDVGVPKGRFRTAGMIPAKIDARRVPCVRDFIAAGNDECASNNGTKLRYETLA